MRVLTLILLLAGVMMPMAMSMTVPSVRLICAPDECTHVKCGIPPECHHLSPFPESNGVTRKVDAIPRYRIIPRGGYCGCCDLCQTLLRENESCPLNPIRGMAASSICGDGLKCHSEKHICVKV